MRNRQMATSNTKNCENCGHSAGRHKRNQTPSPCMADYCNCTEYEHIREGEEYIMQYTGGDGFTVRVEALSGVWENSKGIRGFDARLLEPLGNKTTGDKHIVQMHLYDVLEYHD